MKKTWYDKEEDILNIELEEGNYWKSLELPDGIVIDISKEGSLLSIEILKASQVFKDVKKVIDHAKHIVAKA